MGDYRVSFGATTSAPAGDEVRGRLADALRTMPGIARVDGDGRVAEGRLSATFWIDVRLGMADAARDGSRLAKEALKVAGMGDAQLVELSVVMEEGPPGA